MKKIIKNTGITVLCTLLVAVVLFAAPPAANAGEALCELDWNSDGVVDEYDYFEQHVDGTYGGFYVDVYRSVHFASSAGYAKYDAALDWNGDGVVTMDDAGGSASDNPDSFRYQLSIYINWYLRGYTHVYASMYPESDCNDPGADTGDDDNSPNDHRYLGKKGCCKTNSRGQQVFIVGMTDEGTCDNHYGEVKFEDACGADITIKY